MFLKGLVKSRLLVSLLLLSLAMPLSGASLNLGVLSHRPAEVTQQEMQPLVDYLNQHLPEHEIQLKVSSYKQLQELINQNQLDFVFTNPAHYVRVKSNNQMSGVLASLVRDFQGERLEGFGGVIFTRADQKAMTRLADLHQKTIAAVHQGSLGGFNAQLFELHQAGLSKPAAQDLLLTGMPHDRVVEAVLQGQAEVGFVRTGVLEGMIKQGQLSWSDIAIINPQQFPGFPLQVSTRLYPEWPFVALPQVDEKIARQLVAALLLYEPETAKETTSPISFTLARDYQPVETLLRELRLPPFTQIPQITVQEFLQKHWGWVLVVGLMALLLLASVLGLLVFNRRLNGAKQRFNRLFEKTPEPILILNKEGVFIDCNQAALDLIGLHKKSQLIDLTPQDFSPAYQATGVKSGQRAKELLADLEKSGSETFDWQFLDASGGLLDVEVTMISSHFSGQPVVLGVWRDLTARLTAEKQLHELLDRLQKLASHLPGMLYQYRVSKEGKELLPYISEGVSDLFGLPPEQVADHPERIFAAIHPDDLPRVRESIQASAQDLGDWEAEFRVRHLQGHLLWIGGRASPEIQEDGSLVWHGYLNNITQRKEVEQALLASNQELEQFAYVASHDLRQPLRMINSYLQMLERRLDQQLKEETRQMMHFARDGATRLDQMLLSLLEYSRVGRKGQPMQPLAAQESLQEALNFLRPQIEETAARITWQPDAWPQVYASRDELTRLFQNLLGNALKYHFPDQPPQIDVQVARVSEGWQFCVQDQGIGIDPSQFDRLFKVFQRLHTRASYEGAGVGLAVARKIVERHGGRIWVESKGEGQGSLFCFVLPDVNSPSQESADAKV